MSVHAEIEAKFKLDQPQPWQTRLRAAGAVPLGRVLEINRMFDTPEGRLKNADCGLRLREWHGLAPAKGAGSAGAADGALLTFKGPRAASGFKSRTEIQTALDDAAAGGQILNRLGVREVLVFEKIREAWRLGQCEVALDELPRLGWYLEIEGHDPESVTSVRAQLGLADAPLVGETYPALAAAAGERAADGHICLRFAAAEQGGG
jgi:adenylate cyclase class 2